jgi:hypothetical protein
LLFHITNWHLDLAPVLADLAGDAGLAALIQHDPGDQDNYYFATSWVVMARRDSRLAPLAEDGRWNVMTARPGRRVWTDDYGNLLSVTRTWRRLMGAYTKGHHQ